MRHDCLGGKLKAKWLQIVSIWVLVAAVTIAVMVFVGDRHEVAATFSAILAGSIALVSILQLRKNNADGFVRKLVYVGGGSYLILALATLLIFLKG